MEPIVLLGLTVVVYGGYAALQDFLKDLSVCFPGLVTSDRVKRVCQKSRGLKSPVEKMAGVHV
jgi:hypothetical protein